VVVDELNLMGVAVRPLKHDSPLIIHANTMKALPVSPQRFETISRRRSEVLKLMGSIYQVELPDHCGRNVRGNTPGPSRAPPMIEIRRGLVAERDDHEVGSYRLHGIRATRECGIPDRASAAWQPLPHRPARSSELHDATEIPNL